MTRTVNAGDILVKRLCSALALLKLGWGAAVHIKRKSLLIIISCLLVVANCFAPSSVQSGIEVIEIHDAVPGNNGEYVIVNFAGQNGLQLVRLDLASNRKTRIPLAKGWGAMGPALSADGRTLVFIGCSDGCRSDERNAIMTYDFEAGTTRRVTKGAGTWIAPSFGPGHSVIAASNSFGPLSKTRQGGYGWVLIDLIDGSERLLSQMGDDPDTFYHVSRPTLVAENEIIFGVMIPSRKALLDQIPKRASASMFGVKFVFGEFSAPIPGISNLPFDIGGVSAAAPYTKVYFTTRQPNKIGERFRYDVFALEEDRSVKRQTYLEGTVWSPVVSHDGKWLTVLYQEHPTTLRDVYLIETTSGAARPLNIAARLR